MKVELRRIRHRYPYEKEDILRDISFVCENFRKIGVLAESQSGKTTLVRIAAGLLPPSSGNVYYDGIDRREKKAKDCRVGILFADFALPPKRTVEEHILFPLKIRKMPKRDRERESERILEENGLMRERLFRTEELNGIQRLKTALARLSAVPREFVLVDDVWKNFGERAKEADALLKDYFTRHPATALFVSSNADHLTGADEWILIRDGVSASCAYGELKKIAEQDTWNLSEKLWKEGERNGTESER